MAPSIAVPTGMAITFAFLALEHRRVGYYRLFVFCVFFAAGACIQFLKVQGIGKTATFFTVLALIIDILVAVLAIGVCTLPAEIVTGYGTNSGVSGGPGAGPADPEAGAAGGYQTYQG